MYLFEAEVWEHEGEASWHFVTLPGQIGDEIHARTERRRAFGSVPVDAKIGETSWSTSLFPDSKTQSYVLPVKRSVRSSEGVAAGDVVDVEIELRQ